MKYLSIIPILLSLCPLLLSCEAEIDVTPENEPEETAPKFNFLVRQMESEKLIIDTTFVNDTTYIIDTTYIQNINPVIDSSLSVDSIPVIDTTFLIDTITMFDTTIFMDTIKAELYIKQLDYPAEEEKYKLIVTLPSDFDGLIHYNGAQHRSGDWIEIPYKHLINNATVINITQRKPTAGQFIFNMECSDSKEKYRKTASLAVKVP